MKRARRPRIAVAFAALLAGCAPTALDLRSLESRHAGLAAIEGRRLGDITPYLLPSHGEVVYFLCRWQTEDPVPVVYPADATADERAFLDRVVGAWQGAGLGVRFDASAPAERAGRGIEIRFVEAPEEATGTTYAANTAADCAVDAAAFDAELSERLPARLVRASIWMWRGGFDDIGRAVRHSPAEMLGSALHEFGHALGFQGHVAVGGSVMVVNKDTVRRIGARTVRGEPFAAPTLRALYSLPSGTIVKRVRVGAERTEPLDRVARFAVRAGWDGPNVRVGDRDGFVFWRAGEGAIHRVRAPAVRASMRDPARFELRVPADLEALLDASRPTDRSRALD